MPLTAMRQGFFITLVCINGLLIGVQADNPERERRASPTVLLPLHCSRVKAVFSDHSECASGENVGNPRVCVPFIVPC